MRMILTLLAALLVGLAAGQVPAEPQEPGMDMLGPLLGVAARSLTIDTTDGIEQIHLVGVVDGELVAEHDRLLTSHGDRAVSATVTVAAHVPSSPGCPLYVLLGIKLADESDYEFQRGHGVSCLLDADVTRRLGEFSAPDTLFPGGTFDQLALDEWLMVSAVRFGESLPGPENPLDGLLVFYVYLSTDADEALPAAPEEPSQ